MTRVVTVQELKTEAEALLQSVRAGETVEIEVDGRTVATLRPAEAAPAEPIRRKPGLWKGKLDPATAKALEEPLPEDILRLFYGEEE